MKRLGLSTVAAIVALGLMLTGSAQAGSVNFPETGKAINIITPNAAGGATDIAARLLGSLIEKDLGVPVQVLNREGAGSQVGITALATAKPDGYTLGYTNLPTALTTYLEPERKAVYKRDSFVPVATQFRTAQVIAVKADSPYRTLKDLVEAARSHPGGIKAGSAGILSAQHLTLLQLEKAAGVQFAIVHFNGGAPSTTALLGGHVDFVTNNVPELLPLQKSGELRMLAVMTKEPTKFMPDVRTAEGQGYNAYGSVIFGISAPAGTPQNALNVLSAAIKRAIQTPKHTSTGDTMGYEGYYTDPDQFATLWKEVEAQTIPLMELAKRK